MRIFITIALIITGLISCTLNTEKDDRIEKTVMIDGNEVVILVDTFYVENEGTLLDVIYHKDKYICVFSGWGPELIILDNKGNTIKTNYFPGEIHGLAMPIFIENDSVFLSARYYPITYYIDIDSGEFTEIPHRSRPVHQDDTYCVYMGECFNNWGVGSVFFQDRKTDSVYRVTYQCPTSLHMKGEKYILFSHGFKDGPESISIFDNPRSFPISEIDLKARFEENIQEKNIIYQNYQEINTVFFVNDIPYYIYYRSRAEIFGKIREHKTYIGKIDNRELISLYTFDFKFIPYFEQQVNENKQILMFEITDNDDDIFNNLRGILVIENNRLDFHIIKTLLPPEDKRVQIIDCVGVY
jgi:hypothetical protein